MKFTTCCLIFGLSLHPSGAEDGEPLSLRFALVGAEKQLYDIEVESTPGTGIRIRASSGSASYESIRTLARSVNPPLLIYHSRELGQLALVSYWIGGGTGASYSRYFVVGCTESGCHVVKEGLADYVSVTPVQAETSFALQSEFRPNVNGFTQIVRLTRSAKWDVERRRQISHDVLGPVELRYRIKLIKEGLSVQCELDLHAAHALVDILETGFETPGEWAAAILRQELPELDETLRDYLSIRIDQRKGKLLALHARLDQILCEP